MRRPRRLVRALSWPRAAPDRPSICRLGYLAGTAAVAIQK